MDLFEYQAKELFAEYGVVVPEGRVAGSPERAGAIVEEFGAAGVSRVVVKAQVLTGGRGKAGGVRVADGPAEATEAARDILGMDIGGHRVGLVLVEAASDIAEEFYFSFLLDRADRRFLSICSAAGGMDIEEVAASRPEQVARIEVPVLEGVGSGLARDIAVAGGLPEVAVGPAAGVIERLWAVFADEDATLVEVNPLVLTGDGRVVAVDGKVTLDDNASFRQQHDGYGAGESADPLEARARERDLNYVKLDGQVGVIGNGAGLVMSTLDVVAYAGQRHGGVAPANFLDIGGGASAEVMAAGLEVVLGDPGVESVFVNVFGGITACDAVADGIVSALELLGSRGESLDRPLVVRLDGNNAAEGRRILETAGNPLVEQVATMDGAAERAAALAAG